MLRAAFVAVVLFAAHASAASASAQAMRCRTGYAAVKTDQIKSLRYQGTAEIRGSQLFYQATLGAAGKSGGSFLLTLSSTNLTSLGRLTTPGVLTRSRLICARIDPSNYLARTQKLVPGSSLTPRYYSYEVDTAQTFPK